MPNFDEARIEKALRKLKENDFNFVITAKEEEITQKTLEKWNRLYGKRFLGEEARVTSLIPRLEPLVEKRVKEKERELYKDRLKVLEELTTPSKSVVKADKEITEANALVAKKAANLKLKAMKRLEDLIDFVSTDHLLKAIDVLNRVDAEPKEDVKSRTNSFLQLVQKQVIVNKLNNQE